MFEIESPIIAAVRTESELNNAAKADVDIVFILSSNITIAAKQLSLLHENKKLAFFHYDFFGGLGKDRFGVRYLKELGADGIISTKSDIISYAKEASLITVQRFFIVDSKSIVTALETAEKLSPDMVELMPGIIPTIIEKFVKRAKIKVIAGGLITTKQEIIDTLKAGAFAVSTSKEELWKE